MSTLPTLFCGPSRQSFQMFPVSEELSPRVSRRSPLAPYPSSVFRITDAPSRRHVIFPPGIVLEGSPFIDLGLEQWLVSLFGPIILVDLRSRTRQPDAFWINSSALTPLFSLSAPRQGLQPRAPRLMALLFETLLPVHNFLPVFLCGQCVFFFALKAFLSKGTVLSLPSISPAYLFSFFPAALRLG